MSQSQDELENRLRCLEQRQEELEAIVASERVLTHRTWALSQMQQRLLWAGFLSIASALLCIAPEFLPEEWQSKLESGELAKNAGYVLALGTGGGALYAVFTKFQGEDDDKIKHSR